MNKLRTSYSPVFKAKIALEAIKDQKSVSELAGQYQVHSSQIRSWKAIANEGVTDLFTNKRHREDRDKEELIEELYRQIGQLKVELDWLKKKSQMFD